MSWPHGVLLRRSDGRSAHGEAAHGPAGSHAPAKRPRSRRRARRGGKPFRNAPAGRALALPCLAAAPRPADPGLHRTLDFDAERMNPGAPLRPRSGMGGPSAPVSPRHRARPTGHLEPETIRGARGAASRLRLESYWAASYKGPGPPGTVKLASGRVEADPR